MTRPAAAMHLWLVLMKSHRTLQRHAEHSILALDMCLSDFAVLELLLHKGPAMVNAIGRTIELTSGAATTAVDRLEQRGLVARSFDSVDRRARVVSLTPSGEALIRSVFAEHAAGMARAANGLTASEVKTLTHLLKKLGTTAGEPEQATPRPGVRS